MVDEMKKYVCKRILMMVPVLIGVIFVVFVLLELAPGEPVTMLLGENPNPEDAALLREELGLNRPFLIRFADYVKNIFLHFDFGNSYQTGRSVLDACLERYPTTLTLAVLGTAMIFLIGLPFGIISALKRYTVVDAVCSTFAMIGAAMPRFWLGLLFIIAFSLNLKWFPASGFTSPKQWVLPALTIGIGGCASFLRTTRSSMLDVIRQDYIRTARAKGQSEGKIVTHHMLRNALLPMITVIGIEFGQMLGGAMVTEVVFSIPGLSNFIIANIRARDYPVVLGGVLLIAFCYSVLNLIVDILYAFADPRVKASM